MVKLREGAFYKTRRGTTIGPLYKNDNHTASTHPWRADGSRFNTWTSAGKYGHGDHVSGLDIVEEVVPPEGTPYHNTVEGNLAFQIARRTKALEKVEEAYALLDGVTDDFLSVALTRLRHEIGVLKEASDIIGAV